MRMLNILASAGTTPFQPTSPPPPPPPPPGVPDAPTDLALSTRAPTTWTGTYTDNSDDETGFRIKADGSTKGSAAADATTIQATGLTEGTEYDFTVVAFNGSGESPASNTVTSYTQLAAPSSLQAQDMGDFIRFTFTINSSNYANHVVQRDGSDYLTLGSGVDTFDVDQTDADGFTFKVNARASGPPDSDYSNTQTGPPWPT